MVRHLAIGPGAMGFFLYTGVLSKLKQKGCLDALEQISGASAGGILAFLFLATKGDIPRILEFAIGVPVKQIMKPNIKNLLKNYGLVPHSKVRKVISDACMKFMGQPDITFEELYRFNPIKIHIAAYCVDFMKTVYFSVDTTPAVSVVDAVCATFAIPFLFSAVKMKDGWSYIDGGAAETTPAGPFLGMSDTLALRIGWNRLTEIKDIKTYSLNILYSSLHMRHVYDCPTVDIESKDDEIWDFGAENEGKFRMFMAGYSQNIL